MTHRAISQAASLCILVAALPLVGCMDYRASLAFAPQPVPVQPSTGFSINKPEMVLVCDGPARSELNRCRQLSIHHVRESLRNVHRDDGY